MPPAQPTRTEPDEFLRCRNASQLMADERSVQNPNSAIDASLAQEVDHVLWKDAIFRTMDYDDIEVRIRERIVHLYGHVSSLSNGHRAENTIQGVDGVLGINNHLVPDDRLVTEVARELGRLENTFDCKFFTGVSHGVVLLSGEVNNAEIKLLAEKCAANNPNVRGVINNVHVRQNVPDLQESPFLQPSIGVEIFFLDGLSGRVRQVIINPDNRRVVAMVVQGRFTSQRQDLKSLNKGEARLSERSLVIPMRAVRYLTAVSGFLNIHGTDRDGYMEFDPVHFFGPQKDWKAPYPYCPEDVLFPVELQAAADRNLQPLPRTQFEIGLKDQLFKEQSTANDSLGG